MTAVVHRKHCGLTAFTALFVVLQATVCGVHFPHCMTYATVGNSIWPICHVKFTTQWWLTDAKLISLKISCHKILLILMSITRFLIPDALIDLTLTSHLLLQLECWQQQSYSCSHCSKTVKEWILDGYHIFFILTLLTSCVWSWQDLEYFQRCII